MNLDDDVDGSMRAGVANCVALVEAVHVHYDLFNHESFAWIVSPGLAFLLKFAVCAINENLDTITRSVNSTKQTLADEY